MESGAGRNAARGYGITSLPSKESLSPFLRNFLNQNFQSVEDLGATPSLLARLQAELDRDNEEFDKIQSIISATTAQGVSYYDRLSTSLRALSSEIDHLIVSNRPLSADRDRNEDPNFLRSGAQGFGEEAEGTWEDLEISEIESIINPKVDKEKDDDDDEKFDRFALHRRAMVEELESLAGEVARVEKMRLYAESVLKLEQLVGDLESGTAMIAGSGRATPQIGSAASSLRISRAVQKMQNAEKIVSEIASERWSRLVSAVDFRVDRVAAIVRPAVIGDHRALLTSIGWPPPLTAASGGGEPGKLANPLLEMSEDQERKYCQSFMALAVLQAVQQRRRERQLNEQHQLSTAHRHGEIPTRIRRSSRSSARAPLWAVEELISPIAAKAEPHFVKWSTKPSLVFALAYRIAQEFVDVVDDFLQPLIDQAKLAGFSAREEWIFSLVGVVSRYLQAHVLPGLANDLEEVKRTGSAAGSVESALWLHIVDEALAFDNRMKSLAAQALGLFQEGGSKDDDQGDVDNLASPVTLSISAITDRPEWLTFWATVELEDALVKLNGELQADAAWESASKSPAFLGLVQGGVQGPNELLLSSRSGEFRAPSGANSVLSSMFVVMDRCRSVRKPEEQYAFIEQGVKPIAQHYYQELLRRCQDVEALTALADEASMVKVSVCVNAARFCEHALRDWGEDISFLGLVEMEREDSSTGGSTLDDGLEGSIFKDEVRNFEGFRREWMGRLVSSIFRGFEARCDEYARNKRRWLEVGPAISDLRDDAHENILKTVSVSPGLVDALIILQGQLRSLQATLDNANFFDLWRSLADRLDQFLVQSVVLSGAKFSESGGWQFAADVQALFVVFKPYCLRPSAFFKTLHEAVRLLTLPPDDAFSVLHFALPEQSQEVSEALKQLGVRKLSTSTAARVLNFRVLPKL